MKIVIIEDEKDIALLISSFLAKEAVDGNEGKHPTIELATTLQEGLKLIDTVQPEWILLDNNLPDGKGISKITHIKSQFHHTRIVVMSAMSNLKDHALAEGADYFLDKPVSLKDIRSILIPNN